MAAIKNSMLHGFCWWI